MHYATRHLEALREITHGSDRIEPGCRFYATPTDAEYYVTRKMAAALPDPAPLQHSAPPQPIASVAQASVESAQMVEPQYEGAPAAAEAAPTTDGQPEEFDQPNAAPVEATRPRRGRPPRAQSQA